MVEPVETPGGSIWTKKVVLFLISQMISLFGTMLVQYAIFWHVTLVGGSGVLMTISIVTGFLPTFILSPFGGVWADRYDRKQLMVLADGAIALVTLAAGIFFSLGFQDMWLLFLAQALRASGSAVHGPAVNAFLPQLVPTEALTKVNGVSQSIQSVVALISPMVAGVLMTVSTIQTIFFIDVVTAAIAIAVLVGLIHVAPHPRAMETLKLSYFSDMRDGLHYVRNHAFVKRFLFFCTMFFFLAAPVAFLTPLQVTRTYGEEVWRLTAVEIAFSLGMVFGGILISVWGGFKNRIYTMALSSFMIGFLTVALGLPITFWFYLVVMAIIGVTMPLFNTPSTVMLQELVDDAFLGRVFGVFGMISSIMMPMGMLVFGPVADVVKIEWLLMGSGTGLFAIAFFLTGSRVLIELGRPREVIDTAMTE